MKRLMSIAIGLALCAVSVPAQAGGGRGRVQATFQAAPSCQSASAQAIGGGYYRSQAPAIRYEQRVFEDVEPVTTYRAVRRTVRVPVPVVEEEAVMDYYVPEAPVIQQAPVVPAYTQSSAAAGYGASASAAVTAPAAAAAAAPAAVPRRFGLFRRRGVSKSKTIVRN